jgi:asparagine synthase (glutamine-hydrolysing)
MNALAALVYFDDRSVDASVLRRLATTTSGGSPSADEMLIEGSFGLARAGISLVPPEDSITRPVVSHDLRLAIIFEGRIDNRAELTTALRDTSFPPRSQADGEVFACAAAAWGASAWDRVRGDFAAVIVDRAQRAVIAVRDVFGIRPLLYRPLVDGVAIAQTVEALARLGTVTPDEHMMGQYLVGNVMDLAGTSCREIRRVPPGHAATFDRSRSRVTRYASLGPQSIDERRTPDDWAHDLRERLATSVAARLRGGQVGVLLSGGIDSAAIAALAAQQRAIPTRTYSMTFPGSAKDEQQWSDGVVAHLNVQRTHTRIAARDPDFDYAAHVARTFEPAPSPNGLVSLPLRRCAQNDGVAVLLSGVGADELFTGHWSRYADLLSGGHLWALAREWRRDSHHYLYEGFRYSLVSAVGPLVPQWARPLGRRIARINPVPSLITREFASRSGLADALRFEPLPTGFATHAQGELWRTMTGGPALLPLEEEQRWSGAFGADQRYPFLDRTLAEFALGMPESQRWSNATSKVVLRQAVKGLVPERTRAGLPTLDYSFLLVPALRRLVAHRATGRWQVVERGWVDAATLTTLLTTFAAADPVAIADDFRLLWRLWHVVSCELLADAFAPISRIEPVMDPLHSKRGAHDGYQTVERTSAAG